MKRFSLLLLVGVLFFVAAITPANAIASEEKPVIRQVGDVGTLEVMIDPERSYYASRLNNWECEISLTNGHSYWISGDAITKATKVTVINRKIDRKDLDLLNGKNVVIYGKIKYTGHGEGILTEWVELNIFVTDPL